MGSRNIGKYCQIFTQYCQIFTKSIQILTKYWQIFPIQLTHLDMMLSRLPVESTEPLYELNKRFSCYHKHHQIHRRHHAQLFESIVVVMSMVMIMVINMVVNTMMHTCMNFSRNFFCRIESSHWNFSFVPPHNTATRYMAAMIKEKNIQC